MSEHLEQTRAVADIMRGLFHPSLLGLYLHGSAVSGGLRPQSDIDLLAVIDRPMTEEQRKHLLSSLMRISARHPASPGGPRCIELMVFLRADLDAAHFPARAEFHYGEWLRGAYESGELPMPSSDADNTLVIAQARQEAHTLFGPDASEILPEVPPEHVRCAMRDALPSLFDSLCRDQRNVLLTLSRMWTTAVTGKFVAKDVAATWAAARAPAEIADMLTSAREAYLGNAEDDSECPQAVALTTARYLRNRLDELL